MSNYSNHYIDLYAGQRLREARLLRGLNQSELGKALTDPITFQQIQKYEKGSNRISVSRLYEFAEVLRLPITYFLPSGKSEIMPALSLQESRLLDNYRSFSVKLQTSIADLFNAIRSG